MVAVRSCDGRAAGLSAAARAMVSEGDYIVAVGDQCPISAHGQGQGMSYADQMALIKTPERPLFIALASPRNA